MKLFMYHRSDGSIRGICAIRNVDIGRNSLCDSPYSTLFNDDINSHLETYKYSFCKQCTKILKREHHIDIKQLAIYQKLGIQYKP